MGIIFSHGKRNKHNETIFYQFLLLDNYIFFKFSSFKFFLNWFFFEFHTNDVTGNNQYMYIYMFTSIILRLDVCLDAFISVGICSPTNINYFIYCLILLQITHSNEQHSSDSNMVQLIMGFIITLIYLLKAFCPRLFIKERIVIIFIE